MFEAYLDTSDFVFYSLSAIPIVALLTFFLKGKWRYLAIIAFTCLPTLLFLVCVIGSLPWIGLPIDFPKHPWVGMGLVMIPAYNLFWILPAFLGFLLGNLALWVKLHQSR